VETTCFEGDRSWTDQYLGERVAEQAKDLFLMTGTDVRVAGVLRVKHEYPVYTIGYKDELERLSAKLKFGKMSLTKMSERL
jgi:protoporphyrinogen oxidase